MFYFYYTFISLLMVILDLFSISIVSAYLVDLIGQTNNQGFLLGIVDFILDQVSIQLVVAILFLRFLLQIYHTYLLNQYCYMRMRQMTLLTLKSCLSTSFHNFSQNSVGSWVHLIASETENYSYHYFKSLKI